jgi:16S rRNA (guanine966-N2)-methyltransferase
MRLTGGDGKGRRLAEPPKGVRPTSGRAKEVLFQLISDRIDEATVLDLFAGTGALAIEAIARGAAQAVLVELDRKAIGAIKSNLDRCQFVEKATIVPGDVLKKIPFIKKSNSPFDIIFADPPYADEVFEKTMDLIRINELLVQGGVVIFESARKNRLNLPSGWDEVDTRTIGDTELHFFQIVDDKKR